MIMKKENIYLVGKKIIIKSYDSHKIIIKKKRNQIKIPHGWRSDKKYITDVILLMMIHYVRCQLCYNLNQFQL